MACLRMVLTIGGYLVPQHSSTLQIVLSHLCIGLPLRMHYSWRAGGVESKAVLSLMLFGHSRGNSPELIHKAALIGCLQLAPERPFCQ